MEFGVAADVTCMHEGGALVGCLPFEFTDAEGGARREDLKGDKADTKEKQLDLRPWRWVESGVSDIPGSPSLPRAYFQKDYQGSMSTLTSKSRQFRGIIAHRNSSLSPSNLSLSAPRQRTLDPVCDCFFEKTERVHRLRTCFEGF